MFEDNAENLKILFDMAAKSIFKNDAPIMLSNNMEGAILL
jgi:hypothetical protein